MRKGPCHFCGEPGRHKAGPEDGLDSDLFVCDDCQKLLKDPKTGLALVRGKSAMDLRGRLPKPLAESMVNSLMDGLSRWRPRN